MKPLTHAEHAQAVVELNERGEVVRRAAEQIRAKVAAAVDSLVKKYPGREREIESALEGAAAELHTNRVRRTP